MFLYIGVYYSVWFINMYVSIVNWNVIYIERINTECCNHLISKTEKLVVIHKTKHNVNRTYFIIVRVLEVKFYVIMNLEF